MKKYFFFLVFSVLNSAAFAQLSSAELIASYSVSDLEGIAAELGIPTFVITPQHEVDVYRITYNTPDPQGNMTIATGALCIPKDGCDFPIASYQHGTVALKEGVPSYFSGELNVGVLFATEGYIMCLPDYLGLGGSPGLHPYVHSKSEATASADMILSSKEFMNEEDISFNEQLLLLGYSQGGHATMALHKELQENPAYGLTVTASYPLSGPYDVSGIQTEFIVGDEPYATPGYLPYILFAYNSVYGTLFNEPSEIFVPPYDEILEPLFDGTHSMGDINAMCTSVPKLMLKPEVVDSFTTDPNHRFWAALRDNDLYDWVPNAPVRMFYCEGDDQVNYMNAVVALDAFQQNNAPDVEATNLGDGDHGACYAPAVFAAKFGMDGFKATCTTSTKELASQLPIRVFPNPVTDYFTIEIADNSGLEKILLYNAAGKLVHQFDYIQAGNYQIPNASFTEGIYYLKGVGKNNFQTKVLVLGR